MFDLWDLMESGLSIEETREIIKEVKQESWNSEEVKEKEESDN